MISLRDPLEELARDVLNEKETRRYKEDKIVEYLDKDMKMYKEKLLTLSKEELINRACEIKMMDDVHAFIKYELQFLFDYQIERLLDADGIIEMVAEDCMFEDDFIDSQLEEMAAEALRRYI